MALLFKHAYEKPIPLRDVAPGVPDPVAAVVMRALATEPADPRRPILRDRTGRGRTQAWGQGWLAAEQVPIMDAGSIIGAAGHPIGPRRHAAPAAGPRPSPATLKKFFFFF